MDKLPATHSSETTPSFINFGLSASLYILDGFAHIYTSRKKACKLMGKYFAENYEGQDSWTFVPFPQQLTPKQLNPHLKWITFDTSW